ATDEGVNCGNDGMGESRVLLLRRRVSALPPQSFLRSASSRHLYLADRRAIKGKSVETRGWCGTAPMLLALSLERARRTTCIRMAGEQAFALHHYAVRRDLSPNANLRAVKQHRIAGHRGLVANHDVINLQNAI